MEASADSVAVPESTSPAIASDAKPPPLRVSQTFPVGKFEFESSLVAFRIEASVLGDLCELDNQTLRKKSFSRTVLM